MDTDETVSLLGLANVTKEEEVNYTDPESISPRKRTVPKTIATEEDLLPPSDVTTTLTKRRRRLARLRLRPH